MLTIILFAMGTSRVAAAAIVVLVLAVLHTAMIASGIDTVAAVDFMLAMPGAAMITGRVAASAVVA